MTQNAKKYKNAKNANEFFFAKSQKTENENIGILCHKF